jgi:hypothetical protein
MAAGDDIVGGLAQVHVVVGMQLGPSARSDGGDDLVGVHVGRGAAPGLEYIDREVLIVRAARDFLRRRHKSFGFVARQQFQIGVGLGRGGLDQRQSADESTPKAQARDREVLDRALRLRPVQRIGRHAHLAHRVFFNSVIHKISSTVRASTCPHFSPSFSDLVSRRLCPACR